MQGIQKENADLHAACAAKKAARAKSLLEMMALRVEKAAQKKRVEGLTQLLAEELTAWETRVVDERHTENAVTVKEKLTKQVKQLSVRVTEIECEVMNGNETVADLNAKLMVAQKYPEDVAYELNSLRAHLQSLNANRTRWVKASLVSKIELIASA